MTPPRGETVADLLLARVGDERVGLRSHDSALSWDEVVRESAVRAALLSERRLPGPFHVGILLANVPDYLLWLGAAALCGATVVGINPTRGGRHLEAEVRHTDCQLVVTDREGAATLAGLDIGVEPSRRLLIDDDTYPELLGQYAGVTPARGSGVDERTRMLLLFTSGTTGSSKAAICSQGRLAGLGRQNSAKYHVGPDDVCYCPMPLFHGNALMALWAPALVAGASVALTPKFSASRFLEDVRRFDATYFTYVGKAIGYVLGQPERPDDIDNPLTHGFGTEASPHDRAEFKRRFGATLYEGYGSSESAGMVALDPAAPPGALGRPARPEVVVVDPVTLRPCPPAELGEYGRVCNAEDAVGEIVDTAGAGRFEGYYKNPAADAERVRHGWYWTGDLGYLDRAGFLYFAGRSGDWIRVDGENISALVTEQVLRRHPDVVAAAVVAVPDPRSGDQVLAALEVPEGIDFTDLRLTEFLSAQPDLGSKGAPRYVRISHTLPTTGSNKLRKKEIQLEGWRTDDPVYRWVGRGEPTYALMTSSDRAALVEEFAVAGRIRFLAGGEQAVGVESR